MTSKINTLQDIENEHQSKMSELTGLEAKLLELHQKEWEIRTELQHLEIQKERLEQAAPANP